MKSMINAIIYHGENVLVLELPRNIYDIHEKLVSTGCPIAPGRIPLTDNEDDALRVKLYGRIEMAATICVVQYERFIVNKPDHCWGRRSTSAYSFFCMYLAKNILDLVLQHDTDWD